MRGGQIEAETLINGHTPNGYAPRTPDRTGLMTFDTDSKGPLCGHNVRTGKKEAKPTVPININISL